MRRSEVPQRWRSRVKAALVGVAAGAAVVATTMVAGASTDRPPRPADGVGVLTYSLGDTAFRVKDFREEGRAPVPLELTGVVHHPRTMTGKLPLVVLQHGMWETCQDRNEDHTLDWPCRRGVPAVLSHRGYDYLGEALAAQGFVVVSISANGVNAGPMGELADMARAAVGNEHLRLWRDLAAGTGALVGALRDARTGRAVASPFRGHVDLDRVGLMGHSRGGRGVMWQVADKHAGQVPRGVRIRAAMTLASPEPGALGPLDRNPEAEADYRTTRIPVLVWNGNCDYGAGGDWDWLLAPSRAPIHRLLVHGANHNFSNTVWSPAGGAMFAYDDADDGGRPEPGQCVGRRVEKAEKQLTEDEQRRVLTTYLDAFLGRYLKDDAGRAAVLDGRRHPAGRFATVDVSTLAPGKVPPPPPDAEADGPDSGTPAPRR